MVWDLGGVLINFDAAGFLGAISGKCAARPEAMKDFFAGYGLAGYEKDCRKEIASAEFFASVQRNLGYRGDFNEFAADFCDGPKFEPNRATIDLFNELKVKYACETDFWLLSNLNELHYEYIRRRWPGVFYGFAREILSCDVGARKPEPEIYNHLLQLWGGAASDCLFIDDTKINIDAARAQGMRGLLFEGVDKLRSDLNFMGRKI